MVSSRSGRLTKGLTLVRRRSWPQSPSVCLISNQRQSQLQILDGWSGLWSQRNTTRQLYLKDIVTEGNWWASKWFNYNRVLLNETKTNGVEGGNEQSPLMFFTKKEKRICWIRSVCLRFVDVLCALWHIGLRFGEMVWKQAKIPRRSGGTCTCVMWRSSKMSSKKLTSPEITPRWYDSSERELQPPHASKPVSTEHWT